MNEIKKHWVVIAGVALVAYFLWSRSQQAVTTSAAKGGIAGGATP